jgi:hypothetical protein
VRAREIEGLEDEATRLSEGQQIEANFLNGGLWYPGKVAAVRGNGTYDVSYDDGDEEAGVTLVRTQCMRTQCMRTQCMRTQFMRTQFMRTQFMRTQFMRCVQATPAALLAPPYIVLTLSYLPSHTHPLVLTLSICACNLLVPSEPIRSAYDRSCTSG